MQILQVQCLCTLRQVLLSSAAGSLMKVLEKCLQKSSQIDRKEKVNKAW